MSKTVKNPRGIGKLRHDWIARVYVVGNADAVPSILATRDLRSLLIHNSEMLRL